MTTIPRTAREVRLLGYQSGALKAAHFEVVKAEVPTPGPGQVLVRNRWFRVSISTRLMVEAGAEAVKGIPFPPLKPGDTLADAAIGEVVQAGDDGPLKPGMLVLHPLGWREYALVSNAQCKPVGAADVDPAAWLGHGWTAYAALVGGIQVRPGDTVFVSSGAAKARWMQDELGYDAVVTRDGAPFREQLARAAPEGIDVIVDMVGGEQLAAALEIARHGARCVLLGAVSAELNPHSASLKAPVELDSFQLILRGVTLCGFSADEQAPELFYTWIEQAAVWQKEGRIRLSHTTRQGLDAAPLALEQACAGALTGVVLIELGAQ